MELGKSGKNKSNSLNKKSSSQAINQSTEAESNNQQGSWGGRKSKLQINTKRSNFLTGVYSRDSLYNKIEISTNSKMRRNNPPTSLTQSVNLEWGQGLLNRPDINT